MPKRVVIVGAGIIGASIAYHLTLRGADVTVIDAGELGGVATSASWAWINASAGNPERYARLRMHSMRLWHRLGTTLPALDVRWSGGLLWDMPAEELHAYQAEHSDWGYPVRLVDSAEAARIEPALARPPGFAVHVEVEGAVEPRHAARLLLTEAVVRGATVLPRTGVERLATKAGAVCGVKTVGAGVVPAEEVVVAAGIETTTLLASAGYALALTSPPGLLAVTRPLPPTLKGLVMAPGLHMRQRRDGALIAGADYGGSDPGADAEAAAKECLGRMRGLLKPAIELELDHYTIGRRPTPSDGFPAVGRPPGSSGVYVAVMHSGVTLAPAIGRFVADEIVDGVRDSMIAGYGLERFA